MLPIDYPRCTALLSLRALLRYERHVACCCFVRRIVYALLDSKPIRCPSHREPRSAPSGPRITRDARNRAAPAPGGGPATDPRAARSWAARAGRWSPLCARGLDDDVVSHLPSHLGDQDRRPPRYTYTYARGYSEAQRLRPRPYGDTALKIYVSERTPTCSSRSRRSAY